MTYDSQWRYELARDTIAPAYATIADVEGLALVGSAARGLADPWSDLDLIVYWRVAPEDEQRRRIVAELGGRIGVLDDGDMKRSDLALQSRAESWYWGGGPLDGLKLDVTHKLSASQDKLVADVQQRGELNRVKLAVLHSLKRSLPLEDTGRVSGWQSEIGELPEASAVRWARRHLRLYAPWTLAMLDERSDMLRLREIQLENSRRLLHTLYALNREHPPLDYKHLRRAAEDLAHKPHDLAARIAAFIDGAAEQAAPALVQLALETYDLVDARLPGVKTTIARAVLQQRRAQLEDPPEPMPEA